MDKGKRKALRVIGDEWYAGNLCYHLKDKPKCIIQVISGGAIQIDFRWLFIDKSKGVMIIHVMKS